MTTTDRENVYELSDGATPCVTCGVCWSTVDGSGECGMCRGEHCGNSEMCGGNAPEYVAIDGDECGSVLCLDCLSMVGDCLPASSTWVKIGSVRS